MRERLKARAESLGRVDDDNDSTIKKRLDTFTNETRDVIDHYDRRHLLVRVDGSGSREDVHILVAAAMDMVFARTKISSVFKR